MNEDGKLNGLGRSGLTQIQRHPTAVATPISCLPNAEERPHQVVINGGVLAGWHGQRIRSHGPSRCLIQLEADETSLFVEIDENLVKWVD